MKQKKSPAEFLGAKVLNTVDNLALRGGLTHRPSCCTNKPGPNPCYQPCQYQGQQQIQTTQNEI